MSNPIPASQTPRATGVPAPSAKPLPRRRAPRAAGKQRSLLGLGISFLILSGLCLASLVISDLAKPRPPEVVGAIVDPDSNRAAKVVVDSSEGDRCPQRIFDNASGRMVDVDRPCNPSDVDANGRPIYRGTINRLDKIQKSFQGR
jgi:hypothetical protein